MPAVAYVTAVYVLALSALQCSVGAQVNIVDEDACTGSADESLSGGGRADYEPADADKEQQQQQQPPPSSEGPAAVTGTAPASANGPGVSSCQTCLVQRPVQALMGVH